MGQLVTTIVGGVVGFLIGGPMGASIGMALGGMVGATLFGPTIKGPRLNDLKVTASTYGVAIPEIYGTVRIGGNMIWTAGIKEKKKTTRAGKGGPKQTTYTYSASFATAICKGEITNITRIWADSKLIYDSTNNASRTPASSSAAIASAPIIASFIGSKTNKKQKYRFRIYRGDEEQLPDSLIEADKGVGNVSAHRGMCYVVFENMPLEDFGNRIPQLSFEVNKSVNNTFPSITVKNSNGGGISGADDRVWFPDWDNDRLFSSRVGESGDFVDIIDLSTMQTQRTGTGDFWFTASYGFLPHLNLAVKTNSLSNSSKKDFYDLSSGSYIGSVGVSSRSLSGYHYVGGPRKGDFALSTGTQDNMIGATESGSLMVTIGWTRDAWILNGVGPGATPVGWYKTPFNPVFMFPAHGTVYGWRNGSTALQLYDYIGSAPGSNRIAGDWRTPQNLYWQIGSNGAPIINVQPYGERYAARVVLFDKTDNHIFSLGWTYNAAGVATPCAFKYNILTGTFKFKQKYPGMYVVDSSMPWSRIAGGTFGWAHTDYRQPSIFYQIDLQNGDLVRNTNYWSNSAWGDSLYAGGGQAWDDLSSSIIIETRSNFRRIFFGSGVAGIKLSDVVKDICVNSGELALADIDTTGLADQDVLGISIDRECSARDALKLLATGYLFDAYESDYKLKFRTRGNASQVTIPETWVARPGEDEAIKETLTQELEMPLRMVVNYYDITRDHQQGSQSAKRKANPFPTMWTSKEDVVDLPIVFTPDTAKRTADKLLKMAWANRTGVQFGLPWRYLKYDPTDVATLIFGGTTYSLRFTELNVGADFTIAASAVTEKASAYTSTVTGSQGEAPLQTIPDQGSAYPIIVNTPLLRDEDYDQSKQSVCYVSAGTLGFNFAGATIYLNDGIDAIPIAVIGNQTVTGSTINALPYTTAYEAMDEKSVLKVLLNSSAELESVTQEDLLNSSVNAALVGDEVIQFRTAVQQANGQWWLTGLRRARRGTNYGLKTHKVGERFVLLDAESIGLFERPPENYNTSANFRAAAFGDDPSDNPDYFFTLKPRDLQPYTPEDVKITDDGTDVTITMSRRSRITAPLRDGFSVIHYKEGDKLAAKVSYNVWAGFGLSSAGKEVGEVSGATSITGAVPLFDENGADIPIVITFPLADLTHPNFVGQQSKFLIRITEDGITEGIPKWIEFTRIGQGRWNKTDFY